MSPRSPEQFEQMRGESRERILEAALAVFARHGFDRATVRDIAREAGISLGLMYNYFPGKQELLADLFRRSMRDVQESLSAAPPELPPEAALEAVVRGAFAIVRRHRDFWLLHYQIRFQPAVLRALGDAVPDWSERIRSQLEARFRALDAPRPDAAARALFATIDGAAQHFALDPGGYPLDRVADELVERYCRPPTPETRP